MRITRIACVLVFVLAGAIAPVHGQPMARNLCYTLEDFDRAMLESNRWVDPENPTAEIRLWSGTVNRRTGEVISIDLLDVQRADLFGLDLPHPYSSRTGTYRVHAEGIHPVDNPLTSDPYSIATLSRIGDPPTGLRIGDSFTLQTPPEWSRYSPEDSTAMQIVRWRSNKTMHLTYTPRDIDANVGEEEWMVPACQSVMNTIQIQ